MKVFSSKEYESALQQKGFRLERERRHRIYCLWVKGKKTRIFTMVSHGSSEDIRGTLLGKFKRQLFLNSSKELVDFVECFLTHERYIDLLKNKGVEI